MALVPVRQPGDRRSDRHHGAAAAPATSASPTGRASTVLGTVLSSGGLFALVYGFSNAETSSWSEPADDRVVGGQRRAADRHSSRSSAASSIRCCPCTSSGIEPAAAPTRRSRSPALRVFAVFLFLTYYLQQNLGFSPLKTGLAFLPDDRDDRPHRDDGADADPASHRGQAAGHDRDDARDHRDAPVHPADSGIAYVTHVSARAPAHRRGNGLHLRPRVLHRDARGRRDSEAGIASAMVNTSQQVGGSVGTALLSTIFASSAASFVSSHAAPRASPPRRHPRLHHGVLVVGRNLRPRVRSRDRDPPRPGHDSRAHPQGRARPSRDRQLPPPRGCRRRPARAQSYPGCCGAISTGRFVCAASACNDPVEAELHAEPWLPLIRRTAYAHGPPPHRRRRGGGCAESAPIEYGMLAFHRRCARGRCGELRARVPAQACPANLPLTTDAGRTMQRMPVGARRTRVSVGTRK